MKLALFFIIVLFTFFFPKAYRPEPGEVTPEMLRQIKSKCFGFSILITPEALPSGVAIPDREVTGTCYGMPY